MSKEGHAVAVLTGDLTVEQRIAVLDRFRNGQEKVLITTNVLSRGSYLIHAKKITQNKLHFFNLLILKFVKLFIQQIFIFYNFFLTAIEKLFLILLPNITLNFKGRSCIGSKLLKIKIVLLKSVFLQSRF